MYMYIRFIHMKKITQNFNFCELIRIWISYKMMKNSQGEKNKIIMIISWIYFKKHIKQNWEIGIERYCFPVPSLKHFSSLKTLKVKIIYIQSLIFNAFISLQTIAITHDSALLFLKTTLCCTRFLLNLFVGERGTVFENYHTFFNRMLNNIFFYQCTCVAS